jgi:hypothetical protein
MDTMRDGTDQRGMMVLFSMWIPPAEYPTWHERGYDPGTPEQMHYMLKEEAQGCDGQFGHTYWAERHPYYTGKELKGYVWLPGIQMHEVPSCIRHETVIDYRDGRVFMCAIIDRTTVPAWAS